jgi:hypothetical protein
MLPNVMPPVVEDSCLSPMMDRALVRGFGYGGSNISPRARCTRRMAVVADRRRIPDRPVEIEDQSWSALPTQATSGCGIIGQ